VQINVAVVGAGGVVGRKVLEILEEREFPVGRLLLMAGERTAGTALSYGGRRHTIQPVSADLFEGVDLAFFAVPAGASRELAPEAVKRGTVVIDKSNAFRSDPDVPLVVPEVNGEALRDHRGIISSPNCSTIQLVMALAPLEWMSPLRRVVVSTYQSVSGTGRDAVEELDLQSRQVLAGEPVRPEVYPHRIAFNLLPHIDDFGPDHGYSREEMKLVNETRRILGRPDLAVSATTVRVPVEVGHAETVWVETERPVSPEEAREALEGMPGVIVEDCPERALYPTPVSASGRDEVFVGNAVQIAEALQERGLG